MCNLDRFSQEMSWERDVKGSEPYEIEYQEPVLCACGCNHEILLEDIDSYVKSTIWEDEYILNEKTHLNTYFKENDQLVGSQSR